MGTSSLNGNTVILVKQNNSLSPKGFVWLFVGIFAITMTVAIGVSIVGAWFVLPFAGLEVLAFAFVFHHVHLHYEDHESITINSDDVVIEKHYYKHNEKFSFQRYWVKVVLRNAADGTCALFIGSHGKEVEFGRRFMTDEQRLTIAKQLRQQLKNND